jgi:hypothetical protein
MAFGLRHEDEDAGALRGGMEVVGKELGAGERRRAAARHRRRDKEHEEAGGEGEPREERERAEHLRAFYP